MATITQNNVDFSNVPVGSMVSGWDTKYSNANNVLDGKYDPDPENIEKSFNAIEIDWNGAQTNIPGYETINTTGQFISLLNNLIERTTVLENTDFTATSITVSASTLYNANFSQSTNSLTLTGYDAYVYLAANYTPTTVSTTIQWSKDSNRILFNDSPNYNTQQTSQGDTVKISSSTAYAEHIATVSLQTLDSGASTTIGVSFIEGNVSEVKFNSGNKSFGSSGETRTFTFTVNHTMFSHDKVVLTPELTCDVDGLFNKPTVERENTGDNTTGALSVKVKVTSNANSSTSNIATSLKLTASYGNTKKSVTIDLTASGRDTIPTAIEDVPSTITLYTNGNESTYQLTPTVVWG